MKPEPESKEGMVQALVPGLWVAPCAEEARRGMSQLLVRGHCGGLRQQGVLVPGPVVVHPLLEVGLHSEPQGREPDTSWA